MNGEADNYHFVSMYICMHLAFKELNYEQLIMMSIHEYQAFHLPFCIYKCIHYLRSIHVLSLWWSRRYMYELISQDKDTNNISRVGMILYANSRCLSECYTRITFTRQYAIIACQH